MRLGEVWSGEAGLGMVSIDAVNIGFALIGFMCCSLMTIAFTCIVIMMRSTINRVPMVAPSDAPAYSGTPEYHIEQVEKEHWLSTYRMFASRGWTLIDKADSPILKSHYELTFRSRRIG